MAGRTQFIRCFTTRLNYEQYVTLVQRTQDVTVEAGWYQDGRLYLQVTSEAAATMLDRALHEIVGFTQYSQRADLSSSSPTSLKSLKDIPAPPKSQGRS